jgi:hypothetical protein
MLRSPRAFETQATLPQATDTYAERLAVIAARRMALTRVE